MPQNEVVTLPTRMPAHMTFGEIERLAEEVAKCGLFGIKTKSQALVLMSISQAEGRHPALAARDYNIIQNRPAKTAEAMQRDFMSAGGRIEWHDLSDDVADATFSHPQGGKVRIVWDQARVKQAGLAGREGHQKYPRQMLRSRCVSEGVRTVYPMATSGMYVPEEVRDMPPAALPDAATDTTSDLDQFAAVTGEAEPVPPRDILAEAHAASERGTVAFRAFWQSLSPRERDSIRAHLEEFKGTATEVDGYVGRFVAKHTQAEHEDPFGLPPLPYPEQQQADPSSPQPDAGPAPGPFPSDAGQPFAAGDVFSELDHEARAATKEGVAAFEKWWKTLRKSDKDLLQMLRPEYERLAADADARQGLAL